ncbi:uncharacterized protein BO88DRAFT_100520 [Aspergillus vadensis CBS 113365]|uniref:Uncharacterized protein n=1 Tax=Aspergillus vadensis (strain CBS 113365 / IMI 142717 / IBT 24658) TaxID=1448311 RepID=A0A319BR04_ASPVC|nr:hypothetical protein BO88DRAFT_100520 [Aspergillus vadensis CBS 113365]PYH73580.1 hypothetical protein BO88DRAFT_100520 [Aspergillus vadensis CBS 113365]
MTAIPFPFRVVREKKKYPNLAHTYMYSRSKSDQTQVPGHRINRSLSLSLSYTRTSRPKYGRLRLILSLSGYGVCVYVCGRSAHLHLTKKFPV